LLIAVTVPHEYENCYKLPSEAQWEYACRAGTKTPFHFGETITTDLANYNGINDPDGRWLGSYGRGTQGKYRRQTTDVGSFPPNNFGLHDMHGNVLECCLDDWHKNYENAPTDGSAWFDDSKTLAEKEGTFVLRGGSWGMYPDVCRSAIRIFNGRVSRDDFISFRVVCVMSLV
jgi:formylglycine-generating enzyme required for sulfatase activity